MSRILVVDDEPKMTMLISASLKDAGYTVNTAATGNEALDRLKGEDYDLIITDIRLPGASGMDILDYIMTETPEIIVIMMTAFAEVKTAVTAMKKGAADYLIKPFPLDELLLQVERLMSQRRNEQLHKMREKDFEKLAYDSFIGKSPPVKSLMEHIKKVAKTDTPVLITGESGSGKELAARMIHASSRRWNKPFIAINCAALTETLLESELFGHERGAFTGAIAPKPGRFELADGGTIFLDEIGEMSPALQAKLLRVLEENKIVRVGGITVIDVDIRLVTATNRDLKQMIKEGKFREDLYFRINVFPITMPPLRDRRDDIPLLAEYFLEEKQFPHPRLSDEVLDILRGYGWPGNVRELKNILERAVILSGGDPIGPDSIGIDDVDIERSPAPGPGSRKSLEESEKEQILEALRQADGNKTDAARLLGITRRRLYSRMKILGIPT